MHIQFSSSQIPINAEIWYILAACHQNIFDLHGNYCTERLFDCLQPPGGYGHSWSFNGRKRNESDNERDSRIEDVDDFHTHSIRRKQRIDEDKNIFAQPIDLRAHIFIIEFVQTLEEAHKLLQSIRDPPIP